MDVKTTFLNGDLEENVYMKQPEGFIMPRNKHKADQVQVDKTKEFLLSNFSMKDMGEADVIFGIRTKHEEKVSTPLDLAIKLMPNTGRAVDQLEYSRVIGCLMYAMTSTRPDIAYAVGKLSWYTSNPSTHHWHAIIRVFKYLKKTMDYGLYYVGFPSVLEGYFDATFKKQTCITDSTMEAEFVALAAAGKEAKNLIYEIPLWPKLISPISIHYNSATTVAKAYCQIYNEKSRHLGVTYIMALAEEDALSSHHVKGCIRAEYPMPEFVEDETLEQTRKQCKWENEDYICSGHIFNEDASSKKFLVSNFNNYKMVDSSYISAPKSGAAQPSRRPKAKP
ncbi:zinc finger, CCHC-type containing protein [Tanacetum coccineum]